ncbi:MAG: UDP-glucose 4-epimerase GalE [Alphaproteobacteria bacterium]|nr:UDP-glucose 4-epimerase GalE [Alphaproteobacteria bacterium]MCB9697339.1 UDP-glucose 4-epimerase GalE [Alphaproteobacteria bacterium]
MRIVVTGGAGYIGSHAVRAMVGAGHEVRVLDNLSTGHRAAVDPAATLVEGDLRDRDALDRVLPGADAVLHFAARSVVAESVRQPLGYWDNNVGGTIALLAGMARHGVDRIVFSSTAATYGVPDALPIREDARQAPINPYGSTKLAMEQLLAEQAVARPTFAACVLRYFNVVGCAPGLMERHEPETHLLPILLQAAAGLRPAFQVFGEDYATPDGTCIRDYVHVEDLVDAHVLALAHLHPGRVSTYNVGLGRGFSVREVVDRVRELTGRTFEVRAAARREGDPPSLFTDPARIREELGWRPTRDLDDAIRSAWTALTEARR